MIEVWCTIGKIVDFVSNPSLLREFHDQFITYAGHGGLDFSQGSYRGTLFRLPLRTPEQAAVSRLSRRSLTSAEALEILKSLQTEASAMLLFLKSVENIDIRIWHPDSPEPLLLHSCHIQNMTKDLRQKRAFVGKIISQSSTSDSSSPVMTADFTLDIECNSRQNFNIVPGDSVTDSVAVSADRSHVPNLVKYTETWAIANQLGGSAANRIAADPANDLLKLIPWGGVAAFIQTTAEWEQNIDQATNGRGGRAYCFLPLPVETDLPVMVNGFFELSSNRRDVWQMGTDMTGDGKTRAEWNLCLMSDVVAPCYIRLLVRLKDILGFSERYQQLWPQPNIAAPWNLVSKATFTGCSDMKLLCIASLPDGVSSKVAVSINLQDSDSANDEPVKKNSTGKSSLWNFSWLLSQDNSPSRSSIFTTESTETKSRWVECRNAVLLTSADIVEAEENILAHCLLATKQPFVSCIRYLHTALIESGTCKILATPSFIRKSLRELDRQGQVFVPPPIYCAFLLHYCTADLKASAPSLELNNLQIIPLLNDSTAQLRIFSDAEAQALNQLTSMGYSTSSALRALSKCRFNLEHAVNELEAFNLTSKIDPVIFVICGTEECRVFSSAQAMLVDQKNIRPNEIQFLSHQVMQRRSNIRVFQPQLLKDILGCILPSPCLEGRKVQRTELSVDEHLELCVFLNKLWEYLPLHIDAFNAASQGFSIVPCNQGDAYLPLSGLSNMISTRRGDLVLPPNILVLLRMMGVNVVDDVISDQQNLPKSFWDIVQGPTRAGIITVVDSIYRSYVLRKDTDNAVSPFDALSAPQKLELWRHLCSCGSIASITPSEISMLRKFPLLQVYGAEESELLSFDSWNQKFSASNKKLCFLRDVQRIAEGLIPANYVRYETLLETSVLEAIGIRARRKVDYYKEDLLPNASKFILSAVFQQLYPTAVTDMLSEINVLVKDDPGFSEFLKKTSFLPSAQNSSNTESASAKSTLYRAADLFDPRVEELVSLLDYSFFPLQCLQREDILVYLRTIGLQVSLDWTGILACARFISSIDEAEGLEGSEKKRRQGKNLLQFLDKNYDRLVSVSKPAVSSQSTSGFGFIRSLFGEKPASDANSSSSMSPEECIRQLSDIPWIPVIVDPIDQFMPWCSSEAENTAHCVCVSSARNIRLEQDAWFCSVAKRICGENVHSVSLKRAFGWLDPLDGNTLSLQLKALAAMFLGQQRRIEFENSDETTQEVFTRFQQCIAGLIPHFYQQMDALSRGNGQDIISVLEYEPWVWVGDTFVTSDRVARHTAVNASPYLYQLPLDLQAFHNLINLFRIRNEFSARDYLQVLWSMAESTNALPKAAAAGSMGGSSLRSQAAAQDVIPLPDAKIDLAVSIITLLGSEGSINPEIHTVYIPDTQGKLAASTELVDDDVPWVSTLEYASVRATCRFVHKSISSSVASKFGVKSLRLFLVNSNLNQSLFSVADTAVEAFGQSESITNRLKTILDMYPDGNPIFSELIQNADDAGASEVLIMVDENTYR